MIMAYSLWKLEYCEKVFLSAALISTSKHCNSSCKRSG